MEEERLLFPPVTNTNKHSNVLGVNGLKVGSFDFHGIITLITHFVIIPNIFCLTFTSSTHDADALWILFLFNRL